MAIAHLIPDSARAIVTPVLSVALGFFSLTLKLIGSNRHVSNWCILVKEK